VLLKEFIKHVLFTEKTSHCQGETQ
jgi:hypothetical protein